MKITFATVSTPAVRLLQSAQSRLDQLAPGALQLRLHYLFAPNALARTSALIADIAAADAVFLDLMGAAPEVITAVQRGCAACTGQIIPYGASAREFLRLGQLSAESMTRPRSMPSGGGMPSPRQSMGGMAGQMPPHLARDSRNYTWLCQYFQNASEQNMEQLLLLLLREYGGYTQLPPATEPEMPLPMALFSLPEMKPAADAGAYAQAHGFSADKPNVLILFNAHAYPSDTVGCVTALRDALRADCNVYPIGVAERFDQIEPDLRRLIAQIPGGIELILNCKPFRLGAGPMGGDFGAGIRFLEDQDVPYLHPFFLTRRSEREWLSSVAGCTPAETLLSLMLPEMDGATDTVPIGAQSDWGDSAEDQTAAPELLPITERLAHVAARVRRLIALRRKPPSDKRVAVICYNYPPGEATVFGGAFLDTFASVAAILATLRQAGYSVDALSADQLRQEFAAGRAVNDGRYELDWPEAIWYDAQSYQAPAAVSEAFGPKPGTFMAENERFFIPGIVRGNVFIGLQPARGGGDAAVTAYHDKKLPPHHQYIAFYQWLREEFEADVVVHVGTHGTLEFLKGKESGMSADCYPDRLIGDLPHIYLYYCGNPAESMIAKRRSHANLVSYQPPVFVESDLYGEYLELAQALDSHSHAAALSPESAAEALRTAFDLAARFGWPEDLEAIERELYRMRHSLIPHGLHVFGQPYQESEIERYRQTLRGQYLEQGLTLAEAEERAGQAAQAAAQNHEQEGLLQVLRAGYNTPRLGGDIFRSPDILPAGHNLYQFDARLVPSTFAMARGRRIADSMLEAYHLEHGSWPRATAVILWGLETSRTQGETLAQILGFLGVRLAKDTSVWNPHYEIIPLAELGRPRIDVTINICGFFRDMFPNLIENLDDLLSELYDRGESDADNYFIAHARLRCQQLQEEGYGPEEARQLAIARIFGPAEGEYGTGLRNLIESHSWQQESELGLSFTASLRHVYSRNLHGRDVPGLYEQNLRAVEIVSQIRSSHEYEVTDLDHYYEYFGGLAKSVELVRGRKAQMLITDTTGTVPVTETVERSIARGLRTRVLNPKWIDGLLAHPMHGARQIADRFENVLGLAATTGAVDQQLFDDLESRYVADPEIRRRMVENNPHAYQAILERMIEYNERGYWQADEDQLRRIRDAYRELDDDLESRIGAGSATGGR